MQSQSQWNLSFERSKGNIVCDSRIRKKPEKKMFEELGPGGKITRNKPV